MKQINLEIKIDREEFKRKLEIRDGLDGNTPTEEELLRIIKPLIPELKDGETPTKEEILKLIRPLIPKVKNGETPSDGKLLKLIKPLIPNSDTGEQIIEKINKDKKEIIKKEKVEGLAEIESMAKTADANSRLGLRAAGDTVMYYDLSALCNGIDKVFILPLNRRVVGVWGSDVPGGNYRPIVDWTATSSALTLTSAVATPTLGATLFILYVI